MSGLQPGQDIRPHMTKETACKLAQLLYGLKVKSVRELASYDDKNYWIKVETDWDNPHIREVCQDGYVLKVLNSLSSKTSHVEAEHQFQNLLLSQGFNVPVPILNVDGKDFSHEQISVEDDEVTENNNRPEDPSCKLHIVRLLTFIPGTIFGKIPYTPPHLFEMGQLAGRLDRIAKNFDHPAFIKGQTELIWHLPNLPSLNKFAYVVKDDGHLHLIDQVVTIFTDSVLPVLDKLPAGVIHGDFNEQNVVLQEKPGQENKNPDDREYYINGVIDFGDSQHSCYVFEIAVLIMYMMVESNVICPLEAGGHTLAGYLKEKELSELEWQVLKECVAGRFAQSLVLGAYTYMQDPGNEYVLTTAAKGWKRLELLWNTPKDDLYKIWKDVISSYAKQ